MSLSFSSENEAERTVNKLNYYLRGGGEFTFYSNEEEKIFELVYFYKDSLNNSHCLFINDKNENGKNGNYWIIHVPKNSNHIESFRRGTVAWFTVGNVVRYNINEENCKGNEKILKEVIDSYMCKGGAYQKIIKVLGMYIPLNYQDYGIRKDNIIENKSATITVSDKRGREYEASITLKAPVRAHMRSINANGKKGQEVINNINNQ